MKTENFRGIYPVIRVSVLEGEGTSEDPQHIVNYIYDAETFQFIGEINMAPKHIDPKDR